ncbi:glycosyltransferase [Peptostreptococcaceae bacterium AGR-M142]
MKKIAIVINHYPASPRVTRYIDMVKKKDNQVEIKIIAWNRRTSPITSTEDVFIMNSTIGYGHKLKKLQEIPKFAAFVKKVIECEVFDVIHFIDWDMLMICNFLDTDDVKVIYEIFDMPSFSNKVYTRLAKLIERVTLRKVDLVILSSQYTCKFYNKKKYTVLENIPDIKSKLRDDKDNNVDNSVVKIGFIGTIRYKHILENLIDAVASFELVELHFYGDGPSNSSLIEYSRNKNNIFFHGRYNYKSISKIYKSVDFVWGAYPNKLFNVKYAVSNKFYEAQVFKKPIIVSNGTKISEYVKEKNIGYSVNPYSKEEIIKLLEKLSMKEYDCVRNYEKYEEMLCRYDLSVNEIINYIQKKIGD